MNSYRLTLHTTTGLTDHRVAAKSPTQALRLLVAEAGLELADQDGRYGHLTDGRAVSALTEPWGRRKLDAQERMTRL